MRVKMRAAHTDLHADVNPLTLPLKGNAQSASSTQEGNREQTCLKATLEILQRTEHFKVTH